MKKQVSFLCLILFVCALFIVGCSGSDASPQNGMKRVTPVGVVPDSFREIVESNAFYDAVAFDGKLLKTELCATNEATSTSTYRIRMMDLYGKDLAVHICNVADVYHPTTLTATADGGFLFVLGFQDRYAQNAWASEQGFASHIVKCDQNGTVQFDTALDGIEGAALRYCFEKNGQFYFFGTLQTPETKTTGVHSPTDIYMVILDQNGQILKSQSIAGTDYDSLHAVEVSADGFTLSVSSQSSDGDFVSSGSNGSPVNWAITINDTLAVTNKAKTAGRDPLDRRIGEQNGSPVYISSAILKDFDAGTPELFVAYSDFYLIVSENPTGLYEKTPAYISSIWCYTETVYSAYDQDGNLIFRATVDSSPDFDALVKNSQTS